MPADQLFSLLFSIEQATVAIARKHPQLTDKETEAVYLQYREYFKAVRTGKDLDPPTSTIRIKDDLLNEIWEVLLMREENGADLQVLNGSYAPGGVPVKTLEHLYVLAFNEVRKSVRFWRKHDGRKNYLKHIEEHVAEHIPLEMTSHHPAISDGIDGPAYEELNKPEPDLALAEAEYGLKLSFDNVYNVPAEVWEQFEDNFGWRQDEVPQEHIDKLTEMAERFPDQPLVLNELANAYHRAGDHEEGERRALAALERFPDNIVLAVAPVTLYPDPEKTLAAAKYLADDLEFTRFPPGENGQYLHTEFFVHEHAAIKVLLARNGWELAHLRFERLLHIGLPEEVWMLVAIDVVHHFFNNLERYQSERDDELPTPNAVAGAPLASLAVKKAYSVALVQIMNGEIGL